MDILWKDQDWSHDGVSSVPIPTFHRLDGFFTWTILNDCTIQYNVYKGMTEAKEHFIGNKHPALARAFLIFHL